jgi:dienelactone hydrolase
MTHRGRVGCVLFAVAVTLVGMSGRQTEAQDNTAAVDHARRIFDALQHEQFDAVTKEFNAQMAAALSAEQLRGIWSSFHQQVGAFQSFLDQRASARPQGMTAVVLGCQFEKAAINVILAFDSDNKIAGLHFTPRPAPATEPARPTSTKFTEEAVTVGTGDWPLPGTLSMPVGRIIAAVVLVHGSGPGDRDEAIGPNKPFRDLAWGLADRGIAVLRYEKRTRQYAEKMAGVKNLTVKEVAIDDALAAVALLRKHDRIDPKRIVVLGHSLGGTLAPRIAAEDHALAGIVIMAGATRPLLEVVRDQLTYLASINPGAGTDVDKGIAALRSQAPESYWKDFDAYNPAQTAATLTIPLLILQGERDYQVSMQDLQGWRDALRGHNNATIKTYPTLNHLFQAGEGKSKPSEYEHEGHIPDFVLDDVAAWAAKM